MTITQHISIDLQQPGNMPMVHAVQGDEYSRRIEIELYSNGVSWNPPDGCEVAIRYGKPDGKGGIYAVLPDNTPAYSIAGNAITVTLAPQMVTVPGVVQVQVSIIKDRKDRLSTFSFAVDVEEDPSKGELKSENYVNWKSYYIPQTTGATVGQFLQISKVDDVGRIIETSPVENPAGEATNKAYEALRIANDVAQEMKDYSPSGTRAIAEAAMRTASSRLVAPKSASVGQYFRVKEVDTNGVVTAVEAVDAPSGGGSDTPGEDGFSPVATVEQTENGAVITITDRSGTTTATVANGKDGADGQDGHTPMKGTDYFDGVNGKDGYTPVKGVDYFTAAEKAEFEAIIVDEMAQRAQIKPEFANSIDECTDTTKLYVLPDGYIYAYLYKEASGPAYTNLAGAVQENTRQNSSGVAKALDGAITTGFIPVKQGDMVRVKGFDPTALVGGNYPYVAFFAGASESAIVATDKVARGDGVWTVNGDVYEYTPFMLQTEAQHSLASTITHIRINGGMTGAAADVIVTVNEEIVEGAAGGYSWQNTGHAFVPADYESRIIDLEEASVDHGTRLYNLETNIEKLLPKKWEGKKWVVVGDSLTQALNSDGTNANTDKYYHTHIAEETGITVVNMGQGGTGYKKTDDVGAAFYQRIVNIPTDADVITIMGSLNDLSRTANYTIGAITDTETETVCGCINTTLDTLFSVFPLANVGIITPVPNDYYNYPNMAKDERTQRVIEYCEKLTEICHRRSIPVLDMFHESGMRPWDANFKAALMPDGTHANEAGHKILATKIKMFIESLL